MTINKIEISQKLFGEMTAKKVEVKLPWKGVFYDYNYGRQELVVHQPVSGRADEVIEVRTGPYKEFVDYNTGEVGEGGREGHTILYKNEQINRLPPFVTGFITETVVAFQWSPPQKDRARIKR